MAYSIKVVEITDPFARDFGLNQRDVVLEGTMSLQNFLKTEYPEETMYAYVNLQEVPETTLLKNGDTLLVAGELGKKDTLKLVASLAVIAAASYFTMGTAGPLAGGLGGMFEGIAGITLAQSQMLAFSLISLVGSYLINSLLPPDLPDTSSEGFDKSKTYSWTGGFNTSLQMIPKPVVFGTFLIYGNLLEAYTESYNVHTAGISIRDTAYLLYGLTANKLNSISKCYINNIDAQYFSDDDKTIFYNLGTGTQDPLGKNSPILYDNPPGSITPITTKDYLFPDLINEVRPNTTVDIPYHTFSESSTTINSYKKGDYLNVDAPLLGSYHPGDSIISIRITPDMDGNYPSLPATGFLVLYTQESDPDIAESIVYYSSYSQDQNDASLFQFVVNSSVNFNKSFVSDDRVRVYKAITDTSVVSASKTPVSSGGKWFEWEQHLRDFTTITSISGSVDEIELQVVFPRGLYAMSNHDGDKFPRWVTFDFEYILNDGSNTYIGSLYDDNEDKIYSEDENALEHIFGVYGLFQSSHFVNFNLTKIIEKSENAIQSNFLSDGKLKDGTWTIKIRMRGTGGYKYKFFIHAADPSNTNSDGTNFYDCVVSKVQSYNYGSLLNYPYLSCLGVVLNATHILNGQLPKIGVEVVGEYKIPSSCTSNTITWAADAPSENPAIHAINLAYNSLWGAGLGGYENSPTKDQEFLKLFDLSKFLELKDYCDELITIEEGKPSVPRYTNNMLLDSRLSFWDALKVILKTCNATPIFDGQKITVYYEKEDTSGIPVQMFTAANMLEGSFKESFLGEGELAQAITGNYINKNDGWKKTAISYLIPGKDPKKQVTIELPGIIETPRAIRAIKQKLEKTRLLTRVFEFTVANASGISCEVGDTIGIQQNFINLNDKDAPPIVCTATRPIYRIGNGIAGIYNNLDGVDTSKYTKSLWFKSDGTYELHDIEVMVSSDTVVYAVQGTPSDPLPFDLTEKGGKFIIAPSSENFYIKATVTAVEINEDLTTKISAIEYNPQLFDDFYGVTLSSDDLGEINKDDIIVQDTKAKLIPSVLSHQSVQVSWKDPKLKFHIDKFFVYKKRNSESYHKIATVTEYSYVDYDIAIGDTVFYRVLPVVIANNTEFTIPLNWAETSPELRVSNKLFDYLEAPEYTVRASKNPSGDNIFDITVSVTNDDNWFYRDRREGFFIWTRLSDSSSTDDWFGPINCTLKYSVNAGATSITVNNFEGFPERFDAAGDYGGVILIGHTDLVIFWGATDNGDGSWTLSGIPTAGKFAINHSHSAGERVFNAHKGFFPIKYVGLNTTNNITIYDTGKQVVCQTIYEYDFASNKIKPTGSFNPIFDNLVENPIVYVDGNFNNVVAINKVLNDNSGNKIILLNQSVSASDFTINLVARDVTGTPLGIFEMYWSHPSGFKQFQVTEDKLEGTIGGFELSRPNGWLAVNRVFFDKDPEQDPNAHLWVSNLRMYGV